MWCGQLLNGKAFVFFFLISPENSVNNFHLSCGFSSVNRNRSPKASKYDIFFLHQEVEVKSNLVIFICRNIQDIRHSSRKFADSVVVGKARNELLEWSAADGGHIRQILAFQQAFLRQKAMWNVSGIKNNNSYACRALEKYID